MSLDAPADLEQAAPTVSGFDPEESIRYSRHLGLAEIGEAGQRRLKQASVLVVGAGGLGSPAAMYLAAAGIGRLGLIDFDRVDLSNLQRQLLYDTKSVGAPKTSAARSRLEGINPHVRVETFREELTSRNAMEIVHGYDVVVDGTDNFKTRYLTNDACVLLGKPNVYGSVLRFEGQASVLATTAGPCYRCLFREPPPPGVVPSCAEAGVLGVLPGLVGMIQATEAIKLVLGVGETLIGRLLLVDALRMRFRTVQLRRDPLCPACGTRELRGLIDYDEFCSVREPARPRAAVGEISPHELAVRMRASGSLALIDVREPYEWQIAHIAGARLVPLSRFSAEDLADVARDDEIVVYCHHGHRSRTAAEKLASAGFRRVRNLTGGIARWSAEVDPTMPTY